MSTDDPLGPEIEAKLSKMANEREALPTHLEDRVVTRLRNEGILATPSLSWQWRILAACAAIVLFFAGLFVGRATAKAQAPEFNYVLLLQQGAAFHQAQNLREEEQRVNEYRQWAAQIRARGVAISGLKLEQESSVVSAAPAFADIAGIFMIRTANESEARRIAESCPHLRYGGGVMIKAIAKT